MPQGQQMSVLGLNNLQASAFCGYATRSDVHVDALQNWVLNKLNHIQQKRGAMAAEYRFHQRYINEQTKTPTISRRRNVLIPVRNFGGATQSRTGLDGFAIRCIGVLPLHQQ